MATEAALLRAAARAGVPVARVVASDDGTVLGSAGHGGRAAGGRDHRPQAPARRRVGGGPRARSARRCGAALAAIHAIPRRRGARRCSRPTRWRSTARCSTGSASPTPPSSSASGGWRRTGRRPNPPCVVHGDFRHGQPARRPRRAAGGARLGAGPPRRPAGGPRLALRAGVAVRVAAARPAGSATREELVAAYEAASGRTVDPRGAALVGGARHAEVGRHVHHAGVGPPERRVPLGGAGHHRPAGVRERVRPARPAARRLAAAPPSPGAASPGRRCTTGRRWRSWWRRCASASTATCGRPPRDGCRFHARVAANALRHGRAGAGARAGPHARRTSSASAGSAAPTTASWPPRIRSGDLDDRDDEVRGRSWPPASTTSSSSPTRAGSTTTDRRRAWATSATLWKPPSTWTISPVVIGNQSDSRATQARATASASALTSQPSGARSSHTSSNGEAGDRLGGQRLDRAGGDEVHADALRAEVAGQVARRATRGRPWPRPSSRRPARPGCCVEVEADDRAAVGHERHHDVGQRLERVGRDLERHGDVVPRRVDEVAAEARRRREADGVEGAVDPAPAARRAASRTAATWSASVTSSSSTSASTGSLRAVRWVSDSPRPAPVRTTRRPAPARARATPNASEASVRTPVTRMRLPSRRAMALRLPRRGARCYRLVDGGVPSGATVATVSPMRIGILGGTGPAGSALAARLASVGFET